jgi:hypothetical protein
VRVKDVSMNYDNRPMLLKVAAVGPKGRAAASTSFSIAPVVSDPMTIIRHRLRIRSETQPPTVWYKDEGGRDKCMEVMVELVDSEGRRVHGQEVPLKVSLLYEDLHTVSKQDILKLSSDSRQAIDHTGTATLRLRIEDVSKNHQSKGFVVKVGPDVQHAPLNADISPDISTSVSVRSKRNRRSKHPGAAGAAAAAGMHHPGHAGAAGRGALVDDEVSLVGHALSRSSMELAMPGVPHSILQDAAQLSMQVASVNGGGGGAGVAGGSVAGSVGQEGAAAAGMEGAAGGTPIIRALGNVIAWTRAVVNGLYQIQWQLIGYESRPDGSPDITKPLFNIHNPNAVVTNILQSYRAETMDQLRFLVQALEPAASASASASAQQQGHGQGQGNGTGPPPPPQQAPNGGARSPYDGSQGGGGGGGGGGYGDPSGAGGAAYAGGGGGPPYYGGGDGGGHHAAHQQQQQQQVGRPPLGPMAGLPTMVRGKSALEGAGGGGGGGEFGGGGGGGGGGVGGMLPLVRESTYDLLAGMDPSWFGESEPGAGAGGPSSSSSAVAEASVQTVVAKEYSSASYDTLGFPAFDSKDGVLGFFKEGRNEQGQTVAFFVPLPPSFSDEERRACGQLLQEERARGSGAVVHLGNGDVGQLKERVLTYHWSRGGAGAGMPDGGMQV